MVLFGVMINRSYLHLLDSLFCSHRQATKKKTQKFTQNRTDHISNFKEEIFVPDKHQTQKLTSVISIIEFCQELCFPGFFSFLKVSHDMCRLLPQVMCFFKLHFTLRKKRTYTLIDKSNSPSINQPLSQWVCLSTYLSISQSIRQEHFFVLSPYKNHSHGILHPRLAFIFLWSTVNPILCVCNWERGVFRHWPFIRANYMYDKG